MCFFAHDGDSTTVSKRVLNAVLRRHGWSPCGGLPACNGIPSWVNVCPDAFCLLAYPVLSVDLALHCWADMPKGTVRSEEGQDKVSCKLGEHSAAAAKPFAREGQGMHGLSKPSTALMFVTSIVKSLFLLYQSSNFTYYVTTLQTPLLHS